MDKLINKLRDLTKENKLVHKPFLKLTKSHRSDFRGRKFK